MDSDYLFVYGSLLKQANNIMSNYLEGKSEKMWEASMPGLLFMVDFYPGAVYLPDAHSLVKGDVYFLKEKKSIFEVLDEYEDYDPDNESESLFIRKVVPIWYEDEIKNCWVYLFNQAYNTYPVITSGDYLQYDRKIG